MTPVLSLERSTRQHIVPFIIVIDSVTRILYGQMAILVIGMSLHVAQTRR